MTTFKLATLVGGERIRAHDPQRCAGFGPCCIHTPSNHHMREWKQLYRYDRSIMERLCRHGVGHPDPDDFKVRNSSWGYGVHGCDGCCWVPDHEERYKE